MKIFLTFFLFIFSAYSNATEDNNAETSCDLFFNTTTPCKYKNISINISMEKIADDEKLLKQLNVTNNDKKSTLLISKDASILQGDKGFISFIDINFDSVPDIAITTSFGLANLYLDYWVYNADKEYVYYIGNFPQFKINRKNKSLSNTVKLNAEKYNKTLYHWEGFKLISNSSHRLITRAKKITKKFKLTNIELSCLNFVVLENQIERKKVIDVHEKHNTLCGGDPETSPRLFSIAINESNGEIWSDAKSLLGQLEKLE